MEVNLSLISLIIPDYDDAIKYYTEVFGFELIEDTLLSPIKRWVRVKPKGSGDTCLLLAKAKNQDQTSRIGNQAGGRVFLFLYSDDISRDMNLLISNGVEFARPLVQETWGKVVVLKDKYGNLWDLIEKTEAA